MSSFLTYHNDRPKHLLAQIRGANEMGSNEKGLSKMCQNEIGSIEIWAKYDMIFGSRARRCKV